jgi:hypothetical protein
MRVLGNRSIAAAVFATLLIAAGDARAGTIITPFAPSVYDTNTAAMDATLGISGFTIENFEDTTLVAGLSYQLDGGLAQTSLPATHDVAGVTFNTNWDGNRVLLGTTTNLVGGTVGNHVQFNVAGGTKSFGIGLSSFQSTSPPSPDVPINNHLLYVNGVNFGLVESLPGFEPAAFTRNLYLRIDATGSDVITSVAFENLAPGGDVLIFDHVAIQQATQPVPEPATLTLTVAGTCGILAIGKRVRRRRQTA